MLRQLQLEAETAGHHPEIRRIGIQHRGSPDPRVNQMGSGFDARRCDGVWGHDSIMEGSGNASGSKTIILFCREFSFSFAWLPVSLGVNPASCVPGTSRFRALP